MFASPGDALSKDKLNFDWMSSLVADVLKCTSAGTLDKNDLQSELLNISRRVENIKLQVQSVLSKCYVDFQPVVAGAFSTDDRLSNVTNEARALQDKIRTQLKPQLSSAVSEYENLSLLINRTNVLADMVGRLLTIHESLQNSDKALIMKDYLDSSLSVERAGRTLTETDIYWKNANTDELLMLQALKTDYICQREKLIFSLGQLWSQFLVWVEKESCTLLRVCFPNEIQGNNSTSLFQALENVDHLGRKLQLFAKSVMVHFVTPLLRQESRVKVNTNHQPSMEIEVTLIGTQKSKAEDVIKSLKVVFSFLQESFLSSHVTNNDQDTLMARLGEICADEFCRQLIKECLEPAVPSHTKDFQAYEVVNDQIVDFENYLKSIGFLSSRHKLSYAQSCDSLFASKRCQEILVLGRETMKEDIYSMVPSDTFLLDDLVDEEKNLNNQESNELDELKRAFIFPKCQISEFTGKILNQLHQVLEEACDSNSKDMTTCLYYMARHLSHLYCDVVPVYHQDSILRFPQQTALHHNNCMYLAHHLLTLGHGYAPKLSKNGVQGHKTFVDVALQLRTIGTEAFLQQMRRQRTILLEFLQDSSVFQNMSSKELLPKGSRAVKQCLVHLSSLKKVWLPVLPWEVYLRSIGTLSNSCLEEIIFRIISQDDITEMTTGYLDTILAILDSQMPSLFEWNLSGSKLDNVNFGVMQNQETDWRVLCARHINKWAKFQEIRLLLKFSLRDIVERWAGGHGPLASEVSVEEVKQLIRALFQNTDRRAAALSKIK